MARPPHIPPDHPEDRGTEVTAVDDGATAVAAPAARRRGRPSDPGASVGATSASTARTTGAQQGTDLSPLDALAIEELARTRAFLRVVLAVALLAGIAVLTMGGNLLARRLVGAGVILATGSCTWLLTRLRTPADYRHGDVTAVGYVLIASAFTGVYYWGIFSPAPALILLGIYFFSLSTSVTQSVIIYTTSAAAQAMLAGLIMTGALVDRGLLRGDALGMREQVVTQLLVQLMYLAAFLIARSGRKASLDASAQLERAARQVAQREALLLEVRQDLDRALALGGAGRYTDQRLGRYRLGVLIGRGGMGEVYEAFHVDSDEVAAVKVLHPHILADPDHARRFEREMELAAAIDEPHVTRVRDFGSEGDVPYLVMERLRGHDLAHYLRRRRRLPPSRVVSLIRQVGRGLAAAHAQGIVHRDLKPQNLVLAEQAGGPAIWKILDFGVSTVSDRDSSLTGGRIVGTPGYMAPEQARGEPVDARTDVYALAAIAYRALTGQPPFPGTDLAATIYEVVHTMPPRPSQLVSLPGQIDDVLMIGLAKEPDARFASARELADALAAAAASTLPDALRERASALDHRHPWGSARVGA